MKKALILFIYLFFVGCGRKNLNEYIQSYNEGLEYGSISNVERKLQISSKYGNVNRQKIALFLPMEGYAKVIGESLLNTVQLTLFEGRKNN